MKTNHTTKTFIIAAVSILLLNACGGGDKKSTLPTPAAVTKVKKCVTNTYSSLKKDDKIIALTDDTEVKLRHTQDGKREVCIVTGEAKIN